MPTPESRSEGCPAGIPPASLRAMTNCEINRLELDVARELGTPALVLRHTYNPSIRVALKLAVRSDQATHGSPEYSCLPDAARTQAMVEETHPVPPLLDEDKATE